MKVKRSDRLKGELQKEIYEIISKKLKNPDVTEMFSVTRVDVAGDLSHAKVYVSVFFGGSRTQETHVQRNFVLGKNDTIRAGARHAVAHRARTAFLRR